ncbi:MAG: LysR family transcriptional regulator [Rhodospirillales bacterium]|nr:LysR family transcriptional regulator [Rhodospirillales bacterium]MDE2199084.1 LysR family transcriptional regulator [Rhodospirillales bacterium]MDE2576626.1 LysR family transcriptional regulator [Rhodospirillales bacterium]
MAPLQGSLRDIRLFVAAWEERSFTLAAQREHATQSGVSQHIRNLESAFGVQLFIRDKGRIAPTPAADAYYRRAIDVLRAHDSASRVLRAYCEGLDGQIVVGLMPTMTRCTLAPALARFVAAHPNVNVRVTEGYSAALTQMVSAGDVDFAIVPAFAGAPGLKSRLFLRTPELLVSAAASPLRHGVPVRLAEQAPLKLVMPSRANTRRGTVETYCAMVGAEITRVIELDAMFGTLDFIARSDWLAILPALIMGPESGAGFTVNPIVDPPLNLDLVLIEPAHRELAPAAALFLDLLAEEARRLSAAWELPAHHET